MRPRLIFSNFLTALLIFFSIVTFAGGSNNYYPYCSSEIKVKSFVKKYKEKLHIDKISKRFFSTSKTGIEEIKKHISAFLFRAKKSPIIISILLAGIIVFLINGYHHRRNKANRFITTTKLSVMSSMVQQACRYIEKNYYNSDLNAELVCKQLVTGKAYLDALFIKELGMKIEEFIDNSRINRVKIMLYKEPNAPIVDIISSTGFSNETELLSRFKKHCDIDLQKYRDNLICNKETFGSV